MRKQLQSKSTKNAEVVVAQTANLFANTYVKIITILKMLDLFIACY